MPCRYADDAHTCPHEYLWPVVQRILALHAPPPRNVFELGCGNGSTAKRLATLGYSVTGVDPSESGIEIARRSASHQLRFDVASTADDLRARYGTFPLVLSLEVIEHCPSSREFMDSFLSLLAPGGVGILSTPYHGYLKNALITLGGRFDRHFDPLWEGGHLKFFTIAKLQQLFAEAGVARYELHRVGRIPPLAKSTVAVVFA